MASEYSIPVCDNDRWQTMQLKDVIYEGFGNRINSDRVFHSNEMAIFRKFVNYHKNHVLVRIGEALHKVHANMAPGKIWDRQRL